MDLKVSDSRLSFLLTYVHSLSKTVLELFTLLTESGTVFNDAVMFRSRSG